MEGPKIVFDCGGQDCSIISTYKDNAMRKTQLLQVLTAAAVCLALAGPAAAAPPGTAAAGPPGTPKWTFSTGNLSIKSSPAMASDGTIYVGANQNLYAIKPDGDPKWATPFTTGGNIEGASPALGPDGTIYVGTWDKKLYAVKPDGSL